MATATDAAANSTVKSSFFKKYFRRADYLLILGIIIISFLLFFLLNRGSGGNEFRVYVNEKPVASGSLSHDTLITVEGILGPVDIEVADGEVRILNSECPNKYCINMGATSSKIKPIVCIPNHLIIEIYGGGESEYDAIIR